MKKISSFLLIAIFGVAACDLQPKIKALPDTVGEFITARYPTLLADPNAQPEIYNSAATDYGVYASPEIYGSSSVDDYVLYSSVDDYIVPPQPAEDTESTIDDSEDMDFDDGEFASDDVLIVPDNQPEPEEVATEKSDVAGDDIAWDENSNTDDMLNVPMYGGNDAYTEITVVSGDTLYLLGKKYDMTVDELAGANNLTEPYMLRVGQKLRVNVPNEQIVSEIPKLPDVKTETKPIQKQQPATQPDTSRKTTTRVDIEEVTVAPGDTLYSLSRKYSTPVNDLAVMNNLVAPFALYAGQKVKVPDLASAPVRTAVPKATTTKPAEKTPATKVEKTTKQTTKQEMRTPAKQQDKKQNVKQQDKKTQTKNNAKQTTPKTTSTSKTTKMPAITARSSSKFSWPVRGKILSEYGAKTSGLFNDGINIAAAVGTTVVAAENGVVAYAGNEVKGMGNLVIIQHSDGWMTVYAHMDSMAVRRGVRVGVGQKIGTVGKTGKVDKPQLHFEVRKGTKAYNPIQYLKK